jgi:hypothetical protein
MMHVTRSADEVYCAIFLVLDFVEEGPVPLMVSPLKIWSVALTLLVTVALGGCSYLPPDPPASVDAAVDAALATFRDTAGVAEPSGYASLIDSAWGGEALKDPDSWIARFDVTADLDVADLAVLADDIDEALWIARATVSSVASLQLPAGNTAPEAALEFSLPPAAVPVGDMVAAVSLLRQTGNIERVYVSTNSSPARVSVTAPARWAETAAALRALPGFGARGLRAVIVSSPAGVDTAETPKPVVRFFLSLEATSRVRLPRRRPSGLPQRARPAPTTMPSARTRKRTAVAPTLSH